MFSRLIIGSLSLKIESFRFLQHIHPDKHDLVVLDGSTFKGMLAVSETHDFIDSGDH